jgi:hypothetical protein
MPDLPPHLAQLEADFTAIGPDVMQVEELATGCRRYGAATQTNRRRSPTSITPTLSSD